jgi:hypothetical protein
LGTSKELNIPTFAFAFLYAVVQAGAKSGTRAGLSTGGGCFGELSGYTPWMEGSEDGDGKGAKAYGVTGMTDGLASVSTLILVVVEGTEGSGGEVLALPEDVKLAELDVDVTAAGNDCGGRVDGELDKEVDGDDDDAPDWFDEKDEDEDVVESEGTAETRAAARRMRTAEGHIDVQWGHPAD